MKRIFTGLGIVAAASFAFGARANPNTELNNKPHFFPAKEAKVSNTSGGTNLSYHNGPVIHSAHVVSIFWGPAWSTGGADSGTASHIVSFFNQFGTSAHWTPITQYKDTTGYVQTTSLGNTAWYDTSTPPTDVTDAIVQQEVTKYLSQPGVTFDSSAVYEVFIQDGSYASSGTSTSCGGPNLAFCAYHSHFSSGSFSNVKYASMPYPSCGGCQAAGFTTSQNLDHFSCHETREAVTDEDGNAWYDRQGNEADDKCAWSPAPFLDNGFGYQYEWSNAAGGCVQ